MPAELIKQQYQRLAALLTAYRNEPLSAELLELTLQFSASLLQLAKSHPDATFAQLQLYKKKLPLVYNLTFNCCLFSALLAARNKINDTTSQQLMCSAITLFAFEQKTVEQYYTQPETKAPGELNQRLCQVLAKTGQAVWLRGYQLCTDIHRNLGRRIEQLHLVSKDQALLLVAARLALLTTANSRFPKRSFAHALRQIILASPSQCYELFAPLLEYPSLVPPGSYVRLPETGYAVVLGIARQGHVVCPLAADNKTQSALPPFILKYADIQQCYSAQGLNQFGKINQWWGTPWQQYQQGSPTILLRQAFNHSYKISQPPATLLNILSQLNQPEQDIKLLVDAIAKEPAFATHLQTTASHSSREKLLVQNTQHGLMMHGFARSGNILTQQALLARLNQHYFPLQHHFINFTQLRGYLASSLAERCDVDIPEQACSLAYFANSGLFTHPALKIQTQWQRGTTQIFDINQLIICRTPEQLAVQGISLATAWHQPSHEIVALRLHNHPTSIPQAKHTTAKLASLLGMSLLMARQLYFNEPQLCPDSHSYVEKALALLHLTPRDIDTIKCQSVAYCHSYSPLR